MNFGREEIAFCRRSWYNEPKANDNDERSGNPCEQEQRSSCTGWNQTTTTGIETGLLLMDRASRGLTDVARSTWRPRRRKASCPGPRSSAAPATTAATAWPAPDAPRGWVKVRAFLVGKREKMTPDSKANEQRLNACGVRLEDFDPEDVDQHLFTCAAHVVIDALFWHRPGA